MRRLILLCSLLLTVLGCRRASGTEPPPNGWANSAPTRVDQVVDRAESQLVEVSQGELSTWVKIPRVGAKVGDYLLLGQGTARRDVEVPELATTVKQVVDIAHARVVDLETARRTIVANAPADAVSIGAVYAELEARSGKPIVVYGTVAKSTPAIGSVWIHLRDGTGDPEAGTHDLTVKTQQSVTVGQRVAFRGTLKKDVDLGFGYHYDALIEDGVLVRP